jgi:hypothetical protein
MPHMHPFGTVLKLLRSRVPGLTQARVAELAGYDPAVLSRMTKGQQDLTGPQTRTRVLRVIQALDEAGALLGLEDANTLLIAANLSPLIEAKDVEAALLQRMHRHGDIRTTTDSRNASTEAPAHIRELLQEYARIWDNAADDGERLLILASAGTIAMRYGQPALGMRLLARAARDEGAVLATEFVAQGAFAGHIEQARAQRERAQYANAWAAGELLTLRKARAWLAALPKLLRISEEAR